LALIEIDNLVVRYGAIEALHGVSLTVERGQIVTLIGANGAGKTTLLRAISSLLPISSGTVRYRPASGVAGNSKSGAVTNGAGGADLEHHLLNRIPAHKVVALGVSHVPEGRGIFPQMSVLENLDLGAYLRNDKPEIDADRERTPHAVGGNAFGG
jgi:branched-chain amino acid transport system ATP-binding protein